jgi:hypothetical protein
MPHHFANLVAEGRFANRTGDGKRLNSGLPFCAAVHESESGPKAKAEDTGGMWLTADKRTRSTQDEFFAF